MTSPIKTTPALKASDLYVGQTLMYLRSSKDWPIHGFSYSSAQIMSIGSNEIRLCGIDGDFLLRALGSDIIPDYLLLDLRLPTPNEVWAMEIFS